MVERQSFEISSTRGKTTVFNLISGVDKPDVDGSNGFDGTELGSSAQATSR